MTTNIVPEPFPPGEFIQAELEARDWKQVDLAEIMGVSNKVVSQLVQNKIRVTTKRAQQLATAFNSKPEEWLKIQMLYDLAKSKLPPDERSKRKSRLWQLAPITQMIKRGWLVETENIDFLEGQFKQFYKKNDLTSDIKLDFAPRKSTDDTGLTKEQQAWFQRALNLAEAMQIKTAYSPSKSSWSNFYKEIAKLFTEPEEIRHIPKVLMKYGIRLIIVEHLPSSKIDGICFWLNRKSPAIALSLRYNRIDWFWFTLCHELAHVHYGDGIDSKVSLDVELVGSGAQPTKDKGKEERRADEFAANFLVNQDLLKNFYTRKARTISNADIANFADRVGVHPGIIAGQLQHKGKIAYSQGRNMLVQVRNIIIETALTDGWGQVVTIQEE